MNNPRLAIRYAKSLIDLATEKGVLDEVFADMQFLKSICNTNPDFVSVLKSPIIKNEKKVKILESITSGRINLITASFMKLLGIKGRELNLPEIINAFLDQYYTIKHIRKVKLTTAAPVSEEIKESFIVKLQHENKGTIELETVVDEKLIGGFVLESEGKLIDSSISKDLKEIKKQFMNNDYIHKLR